MKLKDFKYKDYLNISRDNPLCLKSYIKEIDNLCLIILNEINGKMASGHYFVFTKTIRRTRKISYFYKIPYFYADCTFISYKDLHGVKFEPYDIITKEEFLKTLDTSWEKFSKTLINKGDT